ncbi:MAG TPA: non-homologous end-joining DNA ligase [Mycobacterium sp.]
MTSQRAERTPVPPAPMLATAGPIPAGDTWAFEPKWDGARAALRVDGDRTELFSRNANNLSSSFPELREACGAALGRRRAVLDGEVIVLDSLARPSFSLLQRRLHVSRPPSSLRTRLAATLVIFDVLHLDGEDLTPLPYQDRRAALEDLALGGSNGGSRVVTSPAWTNIEGSAVFEVIEQMGLEGVVAKATMSPYQAGRRSRLWVKTPVRRSNLFAVGGWIPSSSRADAVGSLLVGGYNVAGDLVYCGHVSSGFSDRMRRALYVQLSEIRSPASPFRSSHPDPDTGRVRWVKPVLVGRVEYREFTGRLRHAAWKGAQAVDPRLAVVPPLL